MKGLIYFIFLLQYDITYIDNFKNIDGDTIVYGYNKVTGQYSFWKVRDSFSLDLIETVDSRTRAEFSYFILYRGY